MPEPQTPKTHPLVAGSAARSRDDGPERLDERPDDDPCNRCGELVEPTIHPSGTGWMRPTVLCEKCDLAVWREQWQADDRRRELERSIGAADVPDRAWSDAHIDGVELLPILDRMCNVPPGERKEISAVYIWGDVGTGKSVQSALAIRTYLHRWIEEQEHGRDRRNPIRARYCNPVRLLERHKASFDGAPAVDTEALITCDLLVLDDVGTEKGKPGEKGSDWARSQLYLIVNGRYEERKLTIFTSNYALTEADASKAGEVETLADHYNYTNRTTSRIYQMCGGSAGSLLTIHLRKNWRKGGAQ